LRIRATHGLHGGSCRLKENIVKAQLSALKWIQRIELSHFQTHSLLLRLWIYAVQPEEWFLADDLTNQLKEKRKIISELLIIL